MSAIKPFKFTLPEQKVKKLKAKLALADLPGEHEDCEPWRHGAPEKDIARLVDHWQNKFDWTKFEANLNAHPQFLAPIDIEGFGTHNIHFIHRKSARKGAIPLLILHGWPGSFYEVTKLLEPLVQGGDHVPAFDVVAPSHIGFGFSDASRSKEFGAKQHAEAAHKLMLALGYDEYVVQGGDLGYLIGRLLALTYGPKHVKALHLNNAAPAEPTAETHPELHAKVQAAGLSASDLAGLQRSGWFSSEGNAYVKQNATKPQTVGYFLTDSPVGLLAWLYEKLHDWVDDYAWTDDEILTWTSIYYFSKAGPAATSYIYYSIENSQPNAFVAVQAYSEVPLGIARFPKDLILLPRLWNQTMGPVVYEKEHQKGGHFAAWERPGDIADDLRAMFGRGGGAFGVVKGRSGL